MSDCSESQIKNPSPTESSIGIHQQVPFWLENDELSQVLQGMLSSLTLSRIVMYLHITPEVLTYSKDTHSSRVLQRTLISAENLNISRVL